MAYCQLDIREEIQEYCNQNANIFFQQYATEIFICKISAMLPCANELTFLSTASQNSQISGLWQRLITDFIIQSTVYCVISKDLGVAILTNFAAVIMDSK